MKVIYQRRDKRQRDTGWQDCTQLAYEASEKSGVYDVQILYTEPSVVMSRDNLRAAALKKDRNAIRMIHELHQFITEKGL
jgi:hypothetical protein